MSEASELLTPRQWGRRKRVVILDPDGWRSDGKSFSEPITEDEFDRRATWSTIQMLGARETRG